MHGDACSLVSDLIQASLSPSLLQLIMDLERGNVLVSNWDGVVVTVPEPLVGLFPGEQITISITMINSSARQLRLSNVNQLRDAPQVRSLQDLCHLQYMLPAVCVACSTLLIELHVDPPPAIHARVSAHLAAPADQLLGWG